MVMPEEARLVISGLVAGLIIGIMFGILIKGYLTKGSYENKNQSSI